MRFMVCVAKCKTRRGMVLQIMNIYSVYTVTGLELWLRLLNIFILPAATHYWSYCSGRPPQSLSLHGMKQYM